MRPKAVLLDLDGTLIDSLPDLHRTVNALLQSHGRPPVDADEARRGVGHGAKALIAHVWQATGSDPGDRIEDLYRHFQDLYRERATGLTRPYPDVDRVLRELHDQGWLLALVTNKPEAPARQIVDHLGWSELFGALLGGDSVARRKPDPSMLHEAMARVGADQAVMVGDSPVDVAAGRAAHLGVVGVSWGYTTQTLDADVVIDHFSELPGALHTLIGS